MPRWKLILLAMMVVAPGCGDKEMPPPLPAPSPAQNLTPTTQVPSAPSRATNSRLPAPTRQVRAAMAASLGTSLREFDAGRHDQVIADWPDDAVWLEYGSQDSRRVGKAAIGAALDADKAAAPDLVRSPKHLLIGDDIAAIASVLSGTYADTRTEFAIHELAIFETEAGETKRVRTYVSDSDTMASKPTGPPSVTTATASAGLAQRERAIFALWNSSDNSGLAKMLAIDFKAYDYLGGRRVSGRKAGLSAIAATRRAIEDLQLTRHEVNVLGDWVLSTYIATGRHGKDKVSVHLAHLNRFRDEKLVEHHLYGNLRELRAQLRSVP